MKIRLTASVLKDSDNLAVHAGFTRENLKPFVLPSRFFLNTRVNMNDHLVTQSIRESLMKLLHALVGYLVIRHSSAFSCVRVPTGSYSLRWLREYNTKLRLWCPHEASSWYYYKDTLDGHYAKLQRLRSHETCTWWYYRHTTTTSGSSCSRVYLIYRRGRRIHCSLDCR